MLWRLYNYVAEAIQLCCGGYTAILRRLYSHVAEATWFRQVEWKLPFLFLGLRSKNSTVMSKNICHGNLRYGKAKTKITGS